MRRALMLGSLLSVVAVFACATGAAVVDVNGTIDGNDGYDAIMVDNYLVNPDGTISPTGDESAMDYYGSGLDIDTLYLGAETTDRYVGLSVDPVAAAPDNPFDPDGSPASYAGATGLNMMFFETEPADPTNPPSPVLTVNLVFDDSGLEEGTIYEVDPADGTMVTTLLHFGLVIDSGGTTFDPTMSTKYDVAMGDSLELRFSEDLFRRDPNDINYVLAQLDDTGTWDDDQIYSMIPEPATAGLVAFGALALLRRRRRRA